MISGTRRVCCTTDRSAKLVPMIAISLSDVFWLLVTVAFVAGLVWLLTRMDPHWSAKDGRAFTCKIQPIRVSGQTEGRWRSARAVITADTVKLIVRGIGTPVPLYEPHRVLRESDDPPARKAVFILDGDPLYALRIPASSNAVPVLRSLIEPD